MIVQLKFMLLFEFFNTPTYKMAVLHLRIINNKRTQINKYFGPNYFSKYCSKEQESGNSELPVASVVIAQ